MVRTFPASHDPIAEPSVDDELFGAFANAGWSTPAQLDEWLRTHRLLSGRPSNRRLGQHMPEFERLRELIRAVADRTGDGRSASQAQVAELNRVMQHGPHVHALRTRGLEPALVAVGVGDPLDHARAALAASLARYLALEDPRRLRRCASETCRWVFVDRSPSGRRRWCDMSVCGNRAKVRRHRARRKSSEPVSVRHEAPAGIE
jgi:predicted RNA-binding Zn ribbon-like protein